MGLRVKQRILLAKEESEYGSDPTPTVGANAIKATDIKVNYKGEKEERGFQDGTISQTSPLMGKRWVELSFKTPLKGSGSAGTAPAIGDLFEACGFAETVSAGSSVAYEPASTGHKSVTFYVYDIQTASSGNSRLHTITGARGSVKAAVGAGKICWLEWTFKGIANAISDVETPASATYESTDSPIVSAASFTLNSSSALICETINLDIANDVQLRPDLNSTAGVKGFDINGRAPAGDMNPESVLAATYGWYADWIAATQRALSIVVGGTAGNICTITAPKVTVDEISDGDRNGGLTDEVPFTLGKDSGDDEIKFNFT